MGVLFARNSVAKHADRSRTTTRLFPGSWYTMPCVMAYARPAHQMQ
jgi:hypothetical protein